MVGTDLEDQFLLYPLIGLSHVLLLHHLQYSHSQSQLRNLCSLLFDYLQYWTPTLLPIMCKQVLQKNNESMPERQRFNNVYWTVSKKIHNLFFE